MTTIEPIPSSQSDEGDLSPQFSDGEADPQHANDKPYFVDTIPNTRNQPQMNRDPRIHRNAQIQYISDERTLGIEAPYQPMKMALNPRSDQKDFGKIKLVPLKEYKVPAEIESIEASTDKDGNDAWVSLFSRLSIESEKNADAYTEKYTTMVYLEEAAQSKFLIQFKTENIRLERTDDNEFCFENNAHTSKLNDAIGENMLDHFTLRPTNSDKDISISGQIRGCNREYIFVKFLNDNFTYISKNCHRELYDIVFHVNRTPFQLQHNALEWFKKHNLYDRLVNNLVYNTIPRRLISHNGFLFRGVYASKLNEEQQMAVVNIVRKSNFPLPYLLFGPAGTGKTRTLVAAIEEIAKSSVQCVLVCANSNAACDEITERLLEVLPSEDMFRLYTPSYDARRLNARIKAISNFHKDTFPTPSLDYLYGFRVLICTLCTAGNLVRAHLNSTFRPDHFSHILIDECASTHETMTWIPIAGLCTAPNEVKSSIVLAGDPKQLDAVTRSGYASKLGFKVSFMEQLLMHNLYKRDFQTGEFNPNYITQLVKNYRSHSAILHAANTLFYENKLQVRASKDITDWYIGSNLLPSKKFPVIFHSVQGYCKRSTEDFSLFNSKEVNVVMEYVKKLLVNGAGAGKIVTEKDIGVVTPYKLQSKVIARACRRSSFNDITVGTAEVFQGQEKPVMIVSTVCTNGTLGFVRDPRRMNVIITRAKSLLIIVGDPHTLSKDRNWAQLIEYCLQNRALIQDRVRPFHIKIKAP